MHSKTQSKTARVTTLQSGTPTAACAVHSLNAGRGVRACAASLLGQHIHRICLAVNVLKLETVFRNEPVDTTFNCQQDASNTATQKLYETRHRSSAPTKQRS
jgi:hypothetical protein